MRRAGTRSQRGTRARQTVAPRSKSACAARGEKPARFAPARAARWCRPGARHDRTRSCRRRRPCRGRRPGARVEPVGPAPLRDEPRGGVEVDGAAVVAESLPLEDHLGERRGGERLDRRPALEPAQVARDRPGRPASAAASPQRRGSRRDRVSPARAESRPCSAYQACSASSIGAPYRRPPAMPARRGTRAHGRGKPARGRVRKGDTIEVLAAWLAWALIAVLLAIGEILTPGLFFLGPIALAAIAAAAAAALGAGWVAELAVFVRRLGRLGRDPAADRASPHPHADRDAHRHRGARRGDARSCSSRSTRTADGSRSAARYGARARSTSFRCSNPERGSRSPTSRARQRSSTDRSSHDRADRHRCRARPRARYVGADDPDRAAGARRRRSSASGATAARCSAGTRARRSRSSTGCGR